MNAYQAVPKKPAVSYIPMQSIQPSFTGMKVTSIAIVVFIPLLASCASSGLYYMSDDWCAAHLSASAARCPKDQERVVHNDRERVADNEIRQSN